MRLNCFIFFFPLFFWLRPVLVAACGVFAEACGIFRCSAGSSLPRGTWDLSSPTRIEPASPALEGGFFTTGPPGKSVNCFKRKLISQVFPKDTDFKCMQQPSSRQASALFCPVLRMQCLNRDTDIENKCMDTKGEGRAWWEELGDWD